jgi:uncharacterized LabA/DUF88 family protein
MQQERCLILIDGSNFFFKLKDLQLHNLLSFDFTAFNTYLSRGSSLVGATYFVGKVKTDGSDKSKRMQADQQRLLRHLTLHHYRYSLGYLLKSDGVYHEKGVDVDLAVSILVAAYEDLADRIILVSSDTDLLPAIKKAQEKGKAVEYVGFSHKPSVALVAKCAKSKLLDRADLQGFVTTP